MSEPVQNSRKRSRGWCFTWNNYPEDLIALDSLECTYLVYGKETAPSTLTPHLQGYAYWKHAISLRQARKRLPGTHLLAARGTSAQNRDYCIKAGDFVEFGTQPLSSDDGGDMESDRWILAWTYAKSGAFEEIDADIRIRSYNTLKSIRMDYMLKAPSLPGTCGVWIYGASGCGKTRAVLNAYPDAYIKPRNNWWDGYQSEPVVLVDDFDKFDVKLGGKLKHWADFCPFIAEIKGGSLRIRPSRLIVTSQYKMEDIWQDEETLEALNRRFTVIEKIAGQDILLI